MHITNTSPGNVKEKTTIIIVITIKAGINTLHTFSIPSLIEVLQINRTMTQTTIKKKVIRLEQN